MPPNLQLLVHADRQARHTGHVSKHGMRSQRVRQPKTRACIPCHDRKVRCDAADVGVPCTRCTKSDRSACCALMPDLRKAQR